MKGLAGGNVWAWMCQGVARGTASARGGASTPPSQPLGCGGEVTATSAFGVFEREPRGA